MSNKLHIVAVTAMVKDTTGTKFLIVKRGMHEVKHPGKWALPGGKVEWGETLTEALVREIKEETGVDAAPEKTMIRDYWFDRKGQNVIGMSFVMRAIGGELQHSTDFDDARWITPAELSDLDCIPSMHEEAKMAFTKHT